MTIEERFERIEHLTAGLAEERRKDLEEYKALWRDTQRQVEEVARATLETSRATLETAAPSLSSASASAISPKNRATPTAGSANASIPSSRLSANNFRQGRAQ